MAYQLLFSPASEADLIGFFQYGMSRWGRPQSEAYLNKIEEFAWLLTEQPLIGLERNDLQTSLRSLPVEQHILFYRVLSKRIEILRVLHQKQDPTSKI